MLSQYSKTKCNEILWHSFKRTHHSNDFDAAILLQQYTQNEQSVDFQGHRPKKYSRDEVTNQPEIESETQERVYNSIRDGCHDKTSPKMSRFLFVGACVFFGFGFGLVLLLLLLLFLAQTSLAFGIVTQLWPSSLSTVQGQLQFSTTPPGGARNRCGPREAENGDGACHQESGRCVLIVLCPHSNSSVSSQW